MLASSGGSNFSSPGAVGTVRFISGYIGGMVPPTSAVSRANASMLFKSNGMTVVSRKS